VSDPRRTQVVGWLVEGVRTRLAELGEPEPAEVTEATRLVGERAVLSSLALVCQRERALSQQHSPFRSIGTLADYVAQLLAEQQQA